MPAVLFVCPHCEKQAEVQVTSVTRSRPCPHCSEYVVLQVSCKDRKSKRKALLIAPPGTPVVADEPLVKPTPGPAYEPQSLQGEVFERMKLDPEVQEARRRFILGVAVVLGLVVIATVFHYLPDGSTTPAPPVVKVEDKDEAPTSAGSSAVRLPKNAVGLRYGSASSDAGPQTTLTFQSVSGEVKKDPVEDTPVLPGPVAEAAMHFLKARNTEELLDSVADRAVLDRVIRDHVATHPWEPVTYSKLDLHQYGANNDRQWRLVASLADGSQREVNVVLDHGKHLVDWPSYVAWSTMGWKQFMSERPVSIQVFRVLADETTRFDNAFTDAQSLLCVRLLDPSDKSSPPIFAYVDKHSTVGTELDFHLRENREKPLPLTLRLRFPDDPMTNDQVWIDSVVTAGWITRDLKATAQR